MFKIRAVGCRYHYKPLKQVLAKVAAIELAAALVQILLQELRLYTVVHVDQQCLGVADGNKRTAPKIHYKII